MGLRVNYRKGKIVRTGVSFNEGILDGGCTAQCTEQDGVLAAFGHCPCPLVEETSLYNWTGLNESQKQFECFGEEKNFTSPGNFAVQPVTQLPYQLSSPGRWDMGKAHSCSALKDFIIFFCSVVLSRTCHCNKLENVFEMLVSRWGSLKPVRIAGKSTYVGRVRLPRVSARLSLDGFPWDLVMGTSMNICWEDPNFVISGTLLEDQSTYYRCRGR